VTMRDVDLSSLEFEQLRTALMLKCLRMPHADYTSEEWLFRIVGTVVADTILVMDGTMQISDFT
jgi:hypothetical protein